MNQLFMDRFQYSLLSSLQTIVDEYFTKQQSQPQFQPRPQPQFSSISNAVHHFHHFDSAPLYLMPYPTHRSNVTIINQPPNGHNDLRYRPITTRAEEHIDREEEKKKQHSRNQVIALCGETATAFIGTYVLATDDYVNWCLSGIEAKMQRLRELNNPQLFNLLNAFEEWKSRYLERTQPAICGKVSLIGSLAITFGGLYSASHSFFVGGLAGLTASSCFLLWKYLTTKHRTEKQAFEIFQSELRWLMFPTPSAPSDSFL